MSEAIRWWLILLLAGAVTLPLCLAMFRRLPDRGYTLSKPFGLLFLGYTFWFLNSMHVLPNTRGGIIAALLLLGVIAGLFAYRERDDLRAWGERNWRYIVGVEIAFLLVFMIAVWLRSLVGQISGTEQPMDLMFVNATMRAGHFPPQDPWLSGHTVAYYYFGYLLVGMTGTFAGVPAQIAYNVGLAMIAAFTLIAAFGIVYNLIRMREDAVVGDEDAPQHSEHAVTPDPFIRPEWKPYIFGAAGALMLVVMGNLVWALKFASAYGIGGSGFFNWVDVSGLTAHESRHSWYPSEFFGFFDASRIYPLNNEDFRVITEFPMFSFVLGDLHPHVMALPFVLLTVATALTVYRSDEPLDITFWLQRPLLLVATAIMLGALAFINTWDIATMAFLLVVAAFVGNFGRVRAFTVDLFVQTVSFALPLVLLAILLYVPFYASFTSQADGILPVVTRQGITEPGTRPLHALLFWGPLFTVVVPFVAVRLWAAKERIARREVLVAAAIPVAVLVAWVFLFAVTRNSNSLATANGFGKQLADRGSGWLTAIVLGAILAGSLLALWLEVTSADEQGRQERPVAVFALLLASTAFLLIIGTEFFYVHDVFNARMNTVFKLYYQVWLLLALAGGFALYYLASSWRFSFRNGRDIRRGWGVAVAIVLAGAALYPLGATFDRARPYNDAGLITEKRGLDGLARFSADERDAWTWLRGLAQDQDLVIAEAVGNDYSTAGRVSAATGAPAVLGWGGHEDQWRGGNSQARAGRFEDIQKLYQTTDMAQVRTIVDKYNITYIYVGDLERSTYQEPELAKFSGLRIAFQKGNVIVYDAKSATGEVSPGP